MEYIFVLENTARVIQAEALLKKNSIAHMIMPVPSAIRSGCGLALRIHADLFESAKEMLQQKNLTYQIYIQNPRLKNFERVDG